MPSDVTRVFTSEASPAGGHYSQGIVHADMLYISGQLPLQADGTHRFDASFEEQVELALRNLIAILDAAGSAPENLLKVTVYLADIEHWPAFNAVYARVLGDARPARTVVPVPALHYGYLVEIDAIARCPAGRDMGSSAA